MITMIIDLDDINNDLQNNNGQLCLGQSYVEKFETLHLMMTHMTGVTRRIIWVGEDANPVSHALESARISAAVRAVDDFEGVAVIIEEKPKPNILIARTTGGTTPLFVAAVNGIIVASWKFEFVAESLSVREPDVEACRLFLEHSQTRSRNQIIKGVYMLWPGEAVCFDNNGLSFEQISSPAIVISSALNDDARATDVFLDLITQAAKRSLERSTGPAVEVSGGLDSSCVAVAIARIRPDLKSYGAIQPGIVGQQQRRRRDELINLLKIDDRASQIGDETPTLSLARPECQLTPFDDLYRLQALDALDLHPVNSIDTVLTGIGGDELTKEYSPLRPEWDLGGVASWSAIVAAASRADMFMRRGVWPVNPLVSIPVINFCRALPPKLRFNRQLNLMTLARAGLSDGFLFPRYHEHFGNVLTLEAINTDYDKVFSQSVIADHHIVDISATLALARDATLHGLSWELVSKLYNMAKLEFVLRRYIQ
jgi:asparagine synthase (glutamine-hydrolysing)